MNISILQYLDFNKTCISTTDSSNYALSVVLFQGEIPNRRSISYASHTLKESKIKYSTIEEELLNIVWDCKTFGHYLFYRKFKIYTDHRLLVWLFNSKEPNSIQQDGDFVSKNSITTVFTKTENRMQTHTIQDADSAYYRKINI